MKDVQEMSVADLEQARYELDEQLSTEPWRLKNSEVNALYAQWNVINRRLAELGVS